MNIRYFWAEAEVFLYQKLREGHHPTNLICILQQAMGFTGWSHYGQGFLRSALMMLHGLYQRRRFTWLVDHVEWDYMVTEGQGDLLLYYQYRMEIKFADIQELRLYTRNDSFQMRLDEASPLDRISQQTITLMFEKVDREIAHRRKLLGMPRFIDANDQETEVIQWDLEYKEVRRKLSGKSSSEEYNGDESIYQPSCPSSPTSSVCSSEFVPGTPEPLADPFVDSPNTMIDTSPVLSESQRTGTPMSPILYSLAPPPPASGLQDKRAAKKRKESCSELSPTLRIHTNPRSGCNGILDGVVISPQGPPLVPRKVCRVRLF